MENLVKGAPDWHETINQNFEELIKTKELTLYYNNDTSKKTKVKFIKYDRIVQAKIEVSISEIGTLAAWAGKLLWTISDDDFIPMIEISGRTYGDRTGSRLASIYINELGRLGLNPRHSAITDTTDALAISLTYIAKQ